MGSWKLSPSLQIIFPSSLTGGTSPKNRLQRSLAGVVPGASGSPVFEVSRGEGGWHPGAPSVGVGAGDAFENRDAGRYEWQCCCLQIHSGQQERTAVRTTLQPALR